MHYRIFILKIQIIGGQRSISQPTQLPTLPAPHTFHDILLPHNSPHSQLVKKDLQYGEAVDNASNRVTYWKTEPMNRTIFSLQRMLSHILPILENVEHCRGEPEQEYYVTDE